MDVVRQSEGPHQAAPPRWAQINEIQGATDDSTKVIATIASTIGQMNALATSIASAVEEQGTATAEIARNVQEAARGTAEVSLNITGVTRAAQDSSGASVSILEQAGDVRTRAERLRQEMSGFLSTIRAA